MVDSTLMLTASLDGKNSFGDVGNASDGSVRCRGWKEQVKVGVVNSSFVKNSNEYNLCEAFTKMFVIYKSAKKDLIPDNVNDATTQRKASTSSDRFKYQVDYLIDEAIALRHRERLHCDF